MLISHTNKRKKNQEENGPSAKPKQGEVTGQEVGINHNKMEQV